MKKLIEKFPTEIERILSKYPGERKRSAVMPLLYLAQRETGRISQEAKEEIAAWTGCSLTEVDSVAGFYSLFHEEPGGRYRIQVCTDLPCALRGAEQFLKDLSTYLQVGVGETTPDGLFTLEEVKCLAACDRAPVFQLQGDGNLGYHENQNIESARELINEIRRRNKPGEGV